MPEYELAQEVETVAKDFIEAHHRHLLKAKISYVFRDKAWKTYDSKVVLGRASKRNALDQLLSSKGEDFVIIVGKDRWEKMTEVERKYLVDHELSHCGVTVNVSGDSKFVVRSHVIEEFPENLGRFEFRRTQLAGLIEKPPSAIVTAPVRHIVVGDGAEDKNTSTK